MCIFDGHSIQVLQNLFSKEIHVFHRTKQYQVLTVVNYTKPYEKKPEKETSVMSAGVIKVCR